MEKPTAPLKTQLSLRSIAEKARNQNADQASPRNKGIYSALVSAFFLGLAPIFGKQAILLGVAPVAVAAIRTLLAALLLLFIMLIFSRRYLYIYPAGLFGCVLAGVINGIGSLFYYSALSRLDAGVGQLLYSLYPIFLVIWLTLDKQSPGRLTLVRVVLAFPAVFLLTQTGDGTTDWVGVLQMLIASALYALHIPINQRVLYEMPAQTVTVYTLLAMSIVVVPAFFLSGSQFNPQDNQAWAPIIALTMVTFFSRITLFMGVKHIGGMQTALLGLSELLITLVFAHAWLGESMSGQQWVGAILLVINLLLVFIDKSPPKKHSNGGWFAWINPPGLSTHWPWQPHN